MTEVSVQPLLQKLNIIERKIDSTMELQLEILERFLKETEPLEDEIEAIESKEELGKKKGRRVTMSEVIEELLKKR